MRTPILSTTPLEYVDKDEQVAFVAITATAGAVIGVSRVERKDTSNRSARLVRLPAQEGFGPLPEMVL
jgi:hypothetical protein